ncbi:PTS sugar transporter subunit IIB [Holdemania massiliensis]|uniref:PTS sugar transporter subunit IIB n=1 Tax=Holdemania massiliensis TaxID=1468449 RepID=UPI001F06307D|nr:PTS sugar transporter subunit IIB [Holdemania massiliensis]MCH1939830.1 PTS sugar transporter subunit IIB [Holdemania massiliensis]
MKVLLFCGGGCSSGFVASAMRKYAKKNRIAMDVIARGEGEVMSLIQDVDALLVSPHFAHALEDAALRKAVEEHGVVFMAIDSKDYAMMDGESVCKKLLVKMEEKHHV